MKEVALAVLAGSIVGLVFNKINLPVPAPPKIAGLMGIAGIMLGYWLGEKLF